MKYYYKCIDNNNYIYSCDMIRLNFNLNEKIINRIDLFVELLSKFQIQHNVEIGRFITKSGLNYHYLYNLKFYNNNDFCSVSIGLGLLCKKENEDKGFIEFNPNKCFNFKTFIYFFDSFKSLCSQFVVKRYDLAIDIPIKRDLIKMISSSKCIYHSYIEGKNYNSSLTEYQGRRNHNKFTKLYDKTKESNLNYDLTRIEFTFDREEVNFLNLPNFIILNINNYYLTKREEVFLQLLITNDVNFYLKKLNYRQRKNIKDKLKYYYIKFDLHNFNIIRNYVTGFEFSN